MSKDAKRKRLKGTIHHQTTAVHGRIVYHAQGLGAVTPEMVEQRAKELALIAGRPGTVTKTDRDQAKNELLGNVHPLEAEFPIEVSPTSKHWDEVPGTPGHHTKNLNSEDEQITSELVQEGMDEAVHDQMLRSREEDSERER